MTRDEINDEIIHARTMWIVVDGYELKPCPFCRGLLVGFAKMGVSYFVACENVYCSATGPVDLGKSGAAEKWNDRGLVGDTCTR